MPADGAFYIVTVSGGTVVDKQSNGVFDRNAEEQSSSQHWTVEYGDSPTQVAFQNTSNGGWLRAFTGAAYGKVDCGEKQWWTLEQGPSPGSCWIKCNDYPDAYLCNANGSYVDRNQVYTWPKQLNWTHALTWHFKDANAPGFTPKQWNSSWSTSWSSGNGQLGNNSFSSSKWSSDNHSGGEGLLGGGGLFTGGGLLSGGLDSSSDLEKKIKELEAKESHFAEKESKAKEIEGREAALAERERKIKDLESQETALGKREKEVAAKEAAQKKQADQLAAKEKEFSSRPSQHNRGDSTVEHDALQKKLDEVHAAERQFAAKEAAAAKRDNLATAKEKKLKVKEAELEKKLRESGGGSSANDGAVSKLENDNLKLRLMLKEMENQLEAVKRGSAGGKGGASNMGDEHYQRMKNENERLKNLVAQHFLSSFGDNSGSQDNPSAASNGAQQKQPASFRQGSSNSTVDNDGCSSGVKPSANMSRPVAPPSRTSSQASKYGRAKGGEKIPSKVTPSKNSSKGRLRAQNDTPKASKQDAESDGPPRKTGTSNASVNDAKGTASTTLKKTEHPIRSKTGNDANGNSVGGKTGSIADAANKQEGTSGQQTNAADVVDHKDNGLPKAIGDSENADAHGKPVVGKTPSASRKEGHAASTHGAKQQEPDVGQKKRSAISTNEDKGPPGDRFDKPAAQSRLSSTGKDSKSTAGTAVPAKKVGFVKDEAAGADDSEGKQKPALKHAHQPKPSQSTGTPTAIRPFAAKGMSTPSGKTPPGPKHEPSRSRVDRTHDRHNHQSSSGKPAPGSSGDGAMKSSSNTASVNEDASASGMPYRVEGGDGEDHCAVHYSCGHVLHPTPRKLNRKVLGIMYE